MDHTIRISQRTVFYNLRKLCLNMRIFWVEKIHLYIVLLREYIIYIYKKTILGLKSTLIKNPEVIYNFLKLEGSNFAETVNVFLKLDFILKILSMVKLYITG